MTILFLLIPVSLVLVAFGCWAFFWAVRSGQFEELDAASWDILADEAGSDEPTRDSEGEAR